MNRDLNRLGGQKFDVLVLGGGIYGAWTAWDAALRGLSVAVIDRGDFGGETSANNLRIYHGGLRYLQHLDFNRMRESMREQRIAMNVAPNLVHPLPCAVPTSGRGTSGRLAMRMALRMNGLVGHDRNRGATPGKVLAPGRVLGMDEMRAIAPGFPEEGVTGGALWYDAQVVNPERMVLAIIQSAASRGAVVANYIEAEQLTVDRNRVVGVQARDRLNGEPLYIRAEVTLNAAGPWADELLQLASGGALPKLFPMTQAWNLVLRRELVRDCALGLYSTRMHKDKDRRISRSRRLMFFAPWRGVTLVGTSHRPYAVEADQRAGVRFDAEEVEDLLEEASGAYPAADLTLDDVAFAFGGILPGEHDPSTGNVRLLKHPVVRDHAKSDGIRGLISGVGVKFTTARIVAARMVDLAAAQVGVRTRPCATHETPLVTAAIDDWAAFVDDAMSTAPAGSDPALYGRLLEDYGQRYLQVIRVSEESPAMCETLTEHCDVTVAEVIHACRNEMAMKLADVVRRRTELGKRGLQDESAVHRVAELMAKELGWSASRHAREVAETLAIYRPYALR